MVQHQSHDFINPSSDESLPFTKLSFKKNDVSINDSITYSILRNDSLYIFISHKGYWFTLSDEISTAFYLKSEEFKPPGKKVSYYYFLKTD